MAVGRREKLQVFGGDYETADGTGIRDYIHVMDLAVGHVAALKKLFNDDLKGVKAYNLGTGTGEFMSIMSTACWRQSFKRNLVFKKSTLVLKSLKFRQYSVFYNSNSDIWGQFHQHFTHSFYES